MPGIVEKAAKLKQSCLTVMHAMEESDGGGSRAGGGMYDNYFEDIPEWFRPFGDLPDVDQLRSDANTLVQEACKYLDREGEPPPGYNGGIANKNPELAEADTIKSKLAGWTGQAAVNFHDNYLAKFPQYTDNLYTASYVAYQSLAAVAKLWKTADEDIHKICDEAQRTVDAMLSGCLAEGFNFILTSLPSVIEIGSAPDGEIGLTVIKELAGAGSEGFKEVGSAKTPVGMMEPLKKSIDQLKKDLKDKEQDIKDALDANLGYVSAHKKEYVAAPVAWDLAHSDPEKDSERNERPPEERGQEQEGTETLGDDRRP
jgi:hypothetical protein